MTIYNKTSLKTFFETGDIPFGQQYSDFIDSCVNLAETAVQTMQGAINPTEVITARVSAGNGVFTGTVSAGIIYADQIIVSSFVAASFSPTTVSATTVYSTNGVFQGTGIISAAGTTQATATPLTFVINRGAGVADGVTTGFSLLANRIGLTQYVINGAASANLWPPVGGRINALASNAAFPLVASTPYIILHTEASGYAVK